ncbi:hypothetical protein VitviT2T_000727 [Vitis vinifera]|uniref:BHLH domain-containing protein n=1 Tax=Vitis vinifera TaxID=29760 RepID=A0ABY9BDD0_VITVI|nr:transcription factor bHLH168 [Vitis vinifera]WJZ80849.1 hypothetical protein VitviT2T_000727 [Vitis vinifera]|eukprot:XP_010651149.1 PREDICTED: uncharacterized protein LOC104879567 [Vitis vinifera]
MPRRGSKVPTLTRNVLERNRRMFAKDLLSKLASLINPTPRAPKWKSLDVLDQATAHVKQLEQRVEMLKKRKQQLEGSTDETAGMRGSMSTVFTVTELDSAIEVCLISRSNDKFILTRVLDVLEEEAAPVVAVSYSRVGDKIHYIINSQAVCSRIGIDSSRVHERLKRLTAGP